MAGSTHASATADSGSASLNGRHYSPGREAWRRFRRHKLAVVSAAVLLSMIVLIMLGPILWPVAINDIDFGARLKGPSWSHPFGTDDLGQDILARMIYGGRISLAVGLAAMLVAVVVGTIIGAAAGMSRGWVGSALMWLTDLFLSCRNCRCCSCSSICSVMRSRRLLALRAASSFSSFWLSGACAGCRGASGSGAVSLPA